MKKEQVNEFYQANVTNVLSKRRFNVFVFYLLGFKIELKTILKISNIKTFFVHNSPKALNLLFTRMAKEKNALIYCHSLRLLISFEKFIVRFTINCKNIG